MGAGRRWERKVREGKVLSNDARGSEGHAALGHAPWTGIHPEQKRGGAVPAPSADPRFVQGPRIIQGVRGVRDTTLPDQAREEVITAL